MECVVVSHNATVDYFYQLHYFALCNVGNQHRCINTHGPPVIICILPSLQCCYTSNFQARILIHIRFPSHIIVIQVNWRIGMQDPYYVRHAGRWRPWNEKVQLAFTLLGHNIVTCLIFKPVLFNVPISKPQYWWCQAGRETMK